jgi:hypothetical protein
VKQIWGRFIGWAREWATLPGRARDYREYLQGHEEARAKFNKHAARMGYAGRDYLEAAIEISKRCEGAETALRRIALSLEADEAAKPAPGLSAAELERLALLAEECGEVVQAVGKILRHGYDSGPAKGRLSNRVALEREIGDVRAVMELMSDAGDLRPPVVNSWRNEKRSAMRRWTHHQDFGGTAADRGRAEQLGDLRYRRDAGDVNAGRKLAEIESAAQSR